MSIFISAAMLAGQVLPTIDRHKLDMQARAEIRASATANPLAPRRAAGITGFGFEAVTTICRAAGQQIDPAAFVARLSRAYSMSASGSLSLRTSCAAYLAGSEDARRLLRRR